MRRNLIAALLVLVLLTVSAGAESVELVVSGNDIPVETLEAYARELGGISIVLNEKNNTEDLVTEALTHKDNTDMYFLSTNIDPVYVRLRDKGYLMPIEDETLLHFANSLAPDLRKPVMADGQFCAIPYDCLVQRTLKVNQTLWAELGLEDHAYPDTWEAFIQFIAQEYPTLHQAHPDIFAFSEDNTRSLILLAQNQLFSCLLHGNEKVDFLWNAFSEMLLWFRQVDWTQTYPQEDFPGDRILFSMLPQPYIFDDSQNDYLLLGLGDVPGALTVSLNLVAINPRSTHKSEALALMRLMTERMVKTTRLVLLQDEQEPVIDEEAESQWQAVQQTLKDYEQRIIAEEDATRRLALTQEAEAYRQSEEEFYQKYRYIVGPEAVQRLKDAAKAGFLISYSTVLSHEEMEVLDHLRGEMIRGNIDVGDYVQQLRQRWEADIAEGY